MKLAGPKAMSLLTMVVDNPTGYGRIVRNAKGQVLKIVEQKDASKAQLKIRECNTGVLAAPAKLLKKWIARLKNDNVQREYLLTDIVALAVKDKVKVNPLVSPTVAEVLGINDKVQLAEVESPAPRPGREGPDARRRDARRSHSSRRARHAHARRGCVRRRERRCSKATSRSATACASAPTA